MIADAVPTILGGRVIMLDHPTPSCGPSTTTPLAAIRSFESARLDAFFSRELSAFVYDGPFYLVLVYAFIKEKTGYTCPPYVRYRHFRHYGSDRFWRGDSSANPNGAAKHPQIPVVQQPSCSFPIHLIIHSQAVPVHAEVLVSFALLSFEFVSCIHL